MQLKEVKYRASNNEHDILGFIATPEQDVKIKAVVQIVHGMAEHSYRYLPFVEFLTANGYVVCANDHAGHGKSIHELRGYMGEYDGYKHMTEDVNTLRLLMIADYEDVPYVMLGHSMGSFLARYFCMLYGEELDGIIYSGTGEADVELAIPLCNLMIKMKGAKSQGRLFEKLLGSANNKRFKPSRTKYDWLSRDTEQVDLFINDELCGFPFTYGGYLDLFMLIKEITEPSWAHSVPKNLPTYLISGDQDPIGNFGIGVKEVYDKLKDSSCHNVSMKLFEGGRHEMLNEINREEVFLDIINWLESVVN